MEDTEEAQSRYGGAALNMEGEQTRQAPGSQNKRPLLACSEVSLRRRRRERVGDSESLQVPGLTSRDKNVTASTSVSKSVRAISEMLGMTYKFSGAFCLSDTTPLRQLQLGCTHGRLSNCGNARRQWAHTEMDREADPSPAQP